MRVVRVVSVVGVVSVVRVVSVGLLEQREKGGAHLVRAEAVADVLAQLVERHNALDEHLHLVRVRRRVRRRVTVTVTARMSVSTSLWKPKASCASSCTSAWW